MIAILSAIITFKLDRITDHITLYNASECICVISSILCLVLVVLAVACNSDYLSKVEKIKYEEQYREITEHLEKDEKSCFFLEHEISEYNSAVRDGRHRNDSMWIGWYEYDFWDELQLIDVE